MIDPRFKDIPKMDKEDFILYAFLIMSGFPITIMFVALVAGILNWML